MAAKIRHLPHPLFLSGTAGALCEELQRPGLLPPLTLQITDDKRAECSSAHVTDLPTFPTRSRHYQHLTGLIPCSTKLHLPSVLSLITKAIHTYTLDVERSYPGRRSGLFLLENVGPEARMQYVLPYPRPLRPWHLQPKGCCGANICCQLFLFDPCFVEGHQNALEVFTDQLPQKQCSHK